MKDRSHHTSGRKAGLMTRSAAKLQEQDKGRKDDSSDQKCAAAGTTKRGPQQDESQARDSGRQLKRIKIVESADDGSSCDEHDESHEPGAAAAHMAREVEALAELCKTPEGPSTILQQQSSLYTLLLVLNYGGGEPALQAADVLKQVAACEGAAAVLCSDHFLASVIGCLHSPAVEVALWAMEQATIRPGGADAVLQTPSALQDLAACMLGPHARPAVLIQACRAVSALAFAGQCAVAAIGQQQGLMFAGMWGCVSHTQLDVAQTAISTLADVSCSARGNTVATVELHTCCLTMLAWCLRSSDSRVVELAAAAVERIVATHRMFASVVLGHPNPSPFSGHLTPLLQHSSPRVVAAGARLFAALADGAVDPVDGSAQLTRQQGLMKIFLGFMRSGNEAIAVPAAHVVAQVATHPNGSEHLLQMHDTPAASIMLQSVGHGSGMLAFEGGRAFLSLALHLVIRDHEQLPHFVSLLVDNMEHSNEAIRCKVLEALACLAQSSDAAAAIMGRQGVLPALMRALASPSTRARAAEALEVLMRHKGSARLSPVWEVLGQHVAGDLQKGSIMDLERNLQQATVLMARQVTGAAPS